MYVKSTYLHHYSYDFECFKRFGSSEPQLSKASKIIRIHRIAFENEQSENFEKVKKNDDNFRKNHKGKPYEIRGHALNLIIFLGIFHW